MANLSQEKRQRMLAFLNKVKEEHKDDDETLIALDEIENELNSKKYGLVWEKHEEEVDRMMQDNIPVFTEVKEREIKATDENSYNFLLEGDNLHSLKLLEKTHAGKIDVIYIDPPYNRGKNDFRYNDDYIVKEDGYKHSKWLSFMEERLIVAKELLSDKGLIFISIDDNEIAQLRLLMDEIFGESNFINSFIWKRNSSVKTEKDKFTINTEYVLLYAKSLQFKLNPAYKPLSLASQKLFKFDDNDGRGKYQTVSLQKPRDPGPETTYDYVDNSGKIWKCPPKGWRMKYEKIKDLENDNRLVLTGKSLRVKDYWAERENEGKRIDTLWSDLPENSTGSSELEKVMEEKNTFSNPKPIKLIKRCLEISSKNATILDFFAGSGTTAHAVLELNKEDGGNRKFILCTNNENNICEEVTYERIKRVIHGYADVEGIPANLKYFKTDFIPKDADDVSEELLSHIKEMVELENGITLDNKHYLIVLSDEQADELAKNWSNYEDVKAIYVSHNVLFTSEQNAIFSNTDIHIIPDYYFEYELKEVGETW